MSKVTERGRALPDVNDNSNVGTKPPSQSKFAALKKAVGLGAKGETTQADMKKIRVKKLKAEIKHELDAYRKSKKDKVSVRKIEMKEGKERVRLDDLMWDSMHGRSPELMKERLKTRWEQEDKMAIRELDGRLKPLERELTKLTATALSGERLRLKQLEKNDAVSTEKALRFLRRFRDSRERGNISTEQGNNQPTQQDQLNPFELPVLSRQTEPSLKFRMMMKWDDGCCKEWIYDFLEEHQGQSVGDNNSHLMYQLRSMEKICGTVMFEITKVEWQTLIGKHAGLMIWEKLQSIQTEPCMVPDAI